MPVSPGVAAIAVIAGAATFWALRRGASAAPLWLLLLIVLPWTPAPLPAALLLWSGPMALLVWLAVACCMAATLPLRVRLDTARGARVTAVVALAVGAFAFWHVRPSLPLGDEPHYLVITQSLLTDGDVRIENNHRRRDYRPYFAGDLPPDFRVRGRNGEIYSIHAPGVSALVAPAFAVAGYPGAVAFLLVLSAVGSALAWHLAWRVTERADAAWFGWAAVTFSTTWVFHSFAVFPDGPGGVVVLTGAWALLRAEAEIRSGSSRVRPWLLHGAALATLPWMHTRFAALAGTIGALVLLRLGRTPNALSKAAAFLAAPIVSALGWIAYFIVIYGTPDPSAPYGGEQGAFAFVPDGLAGLLFDQRFGLLAYAPVLLAAFAGVGVMLSRRAWRRHALELLFVAVPYLLVVTYVAMWWGGASAPARFFVPLLPWMAIPAAAAWTALASRTSRVAAVAALLFTAFATAVLVAVDGGRLAFNSREEYAHWLAWLNGNIDLGRGLPVWWRDRETPLLRGIAVWALAAAAGWFLLRSAERRRFASARGRFLTLAAATIVLCATTAFSAIWLLERVDGRAPVPAQLEALRLLSREPRLLAAQVLPPRFVSRDIIPAMLRIEPAFSAVPGGAGRSDRPLFAVPAVPAGDYRLRFRLRASNGWVMIGIGRDQFSLKTEPLNANAGAMLMEFPVDVRAIMVRADEDARRNIRGLVIEPLHVVGPSQRLTDAYARRAVHYPGWIVYFLDDRSFPEPEGFWVGGERESSVVFQPDTRRSAATLLVRNGAADNTVLVESGAWRDGWTLAPGEERQIQLPADLSRGATLVRFTTSAGFRPSEVEAGSRDERYLGIWVKVEK